MVKVWSVIAFYGVPCKSHYFVRSCSIIHNTRGLCIHYLYVSAPLFAQTCRTYHGARIVPAVNLNIAPTNPEPIMQPTGWRRRAEQRLMLRRRGHVYSFLHVFLGAL